MEKTRNNYPDIAPAGSTFSRGVRVGNLLFIAGCTARGTDAQGQSMSDQLRVTLDRIKRIVEAEGRERFGHRQDHDIRHQRSGLAGNPRGPGGAVRRVFPG